MLRSPSPSTESDTTQDRSSTTSCKRRKHYLESGMLYIGPKDKAFKDVILTPLNVGVSTSQSAGTTPKDIFGEQQSTPKSRVILHMEDDELTEITLDFQQYHRRQHDEHTLSTICNDSIVPRYRFIDAPIVGEDRNITKSVRRDKWKPKKEGPSIPMGGYTFDWDIELDTTYGVSIRMFDVKDRTELELKECHPWLVEPRAMVCPYLTVEYKCTEKTGKASDPTYQNTTASVIWLYQRKRIRQALNLALDDLKHFSVTFVDSNFTIWEASFQDHTYHLREVAQGAAATLDGLKLYIEWNNAIHTWGHGANASSFKEDILILLERFRSQPHFPWPHRRRSRADAPQQPGVVYGGRTGIEEGRSEK